ncbi:small metal-binding protein SmbP [Methylobacter sp.]|uniref:small metal-binding protein SmbP n=1 Tax=Methylobacter sp. TaxID=2051955 RepID=UPI002FDE9572
MKKSIFAFSGLLLLLGIFLSGAVFAEEHAYAAIEHTSTAIAQGKADKAPALVEHAEKALEHAKMAENAAKGHLKPEIQSAVDELEKAITAGNAGDAKLAVIPLEKALGFLQAGNK